uniref:Probable RNA-binding protein EIF1AD n=1 Tax=Glossina palpalis gambiensis TaxID=67801 RepID=A0A1B0BQJ9_9MUSC
MIQDSKDGQQIVRIIASQGNNLHEVETADTEIENFLVVIMPTKFRKNVWVKRGDFEPIKEGDKVKAEIYNNVPNGRCASNYVKENCNENVEEFEEKISGPCHLSPNRNCPNLLAAFEDESTSSEDDS